MPLCRLQIIAFYNCNCSTITQPTNSAEGVLSWHATSPDLQKVLLTKLQPCLHVLETATTCRILLSWAVNDTMGQQQRLDVWPAVTWTQQGLVQSACTCL